MCCNSVTTNGVYDKYSEVVIVCSWLEAMVDTFESFFTKLIGFRVMKDQEEITSNQQELFHLLLDLPAADVCTQIIIPNVTIRIQLANYF